MSDLDALENQSIYILREAYSRLKPIAMLWSLGKDSNVMLWLAPRETDHFSKQDQVVARL